MAGVKEGLFSISPSLFIGEAAKLGVFTQKELDGLKIDYSEMGLITFVTTLMSKHFLSSSDFDKIINHITGKRLAKIEYVQSEDKYYIIEDKKKPKPFIFKKSLDNFIKPFFRESLDDFNFRQNLLALYKIDHAEKHIYILMGAPTHKGYAAMKKFKNESKLLKVKQRISYNVKTKYKRINPETGKEEIVEKEEHKALETAFNEYGIKFLLAPLALINQLHAYNAQLKDSIEKTTKQIAQNLKNQGISTIDENDGIFRIKDGLETNDSSIDSLIYKILNKQFEADVSDIHIEPLLDSTNPKYKNAGFVRYRIDGDLQGRETELIINENGDAEVELVPVIPDKYNEIITKLKELSEISTAQEDLHLPGDGKLKVFIADNRNVLLEYRVSTMPEGVHGKGGKDKMVMRKLERGTAKLDLEKMNMDKDKKAMIDEYVGTREKKGKFNNGLILMTGPTGSGKSTTLFSILNQINTPEVNIQTLEDPIEYVIPGINQSQIGDATNNDPGSDSYTYAKGMKACLRQDPDILLIGEIRDEITMEIAKEAASTGHLVFSSLHTNDTWQTLDRLEGLNFDLKLVGNIVRLIMAQRLGKTICPVCIKEYNDPILSHGDPTLQAQREKDYLEMKMDVVRKLLDSPYVMDLPNNVEDIKLYEGDGGGPSGSCFKCGGNKTKGRCGLYEFLPTSEVNVTKFIIKYGTAVDNQTVKEDLYIPEGITTLQQNALLKTFSPIVDKETGEKKYLSYHDALSGAGADPYEWDKPYRDASLKELNLFLKKKKIERKLKANLNEIQLLITQIAGEEKMLNSINKETKMKKINSLKAKKLELETINKKYNEILNTLGV